MILNESAHAQKIQINHIFNYEKKNKSYLVFFSKIYKKRSNFQAAEKNGKNHNNIKWVHTCHMQPQINL